MADNTYRSFRNRDEVAYDSDGVPARAPADPLAQLARLIGQNDPRTEFDQNVAAEPASQEWPAEENYAEPGPVAEPGYDERYDERYDPPRLAEPPAPYRAAAPSQGGAYVPHVPPRSNGAREDARFYAPVEPRYPVAQQAPADYGEQLPAFAAQPHDDYEYDDQDDGRYADEEDEAPSGRRRGGLVIIAAVLGLAVLGTAGAFAYRAMFGGSMMPSLPPIIKADTGPNKIVPSATNAQGRASDQANATTGSSGEKVVSREEQPVDVPAPPPAGNGPRVVSTIPIFPTPPPPQGAWASGVAGTGVPSAPATGAMASAMPGSGQVMPATAAPAPQAPASASTEPKKIHTVAIKPDQAGGPDTAPPAAASAPASRAVAAPKPGAAAMPRAAMPAGGNGPMSIVPTQGEAAAPAPVRTHTAVAQPMAPAAAPSAAASPAGGGYAVQLTSQRSEAEAQSAFRSLAAKYPTQLGGQQPIIRQADLGTKGIYYRALVGPFGSMEQATGLCSSLKAAGGNCIVQRN